MVIFNFFSSSKIGLSRAFFIFQHPKFEFNKYYCDQYSKIKSFYYVTELTILTNTCILNYILYTKINNLSLTVTTNLLHPIIYSIYQGINSEKYLHWDFRFIKTVVVTSSRKVMILNKCRNDFYLILIKSYTSRKGMI